MQPDFWKPDKAAAAELLASPDTTATTLLVLALKGLQATDLVGDETDIFEVDPVELWARMEEFYRCRIHEANENRMNALLVALGTPSFDEDPEAFLAVCNALADGDIGDMVEGVWELPVFGEVLWALAEIGLLRGEPVDVAPPVLEVMASVAAAEDEEPGHQEADMESVTRRMARMMDELRSVGAPDGLVDSIPRRMQLVPE